MRFWVLVFPSGRPECELSLSAVCRGYVLASADLVLGVSPLLQTALPPAATEEE